MAHAETRAGSCVPTIHLPPRSDRAFRSLYNIPWPLGRGIDTCRSGHVGILTPCHVTPCTCRVGSSIPSPPGTASTNNHTHTEHAAAAAAAAAGVVGTGGEGEPAPCAVDSKVHTRNVRSPLPPLLGKTRELHRGSARSTCSSKLPADCCRRDLLWPGIICPGCSVPSRHAFSGPAVPSLPQRHLGRAYTVSAPMLGVWDSSHRR